MWIIIGLTVSLKFCHHLAVLVQWVNIKNKICRSKLVRKRNAIQPWLAALLVLNSYDKMRFASNSNLIHNTNKAILRHQHKESILNTQEISNFWNDFLFLLSTLLLGRKSHSLRPKNRNRGQENERIWCSKANIQSASIWYWLLYLIMTVCISCLW